MNEILNVQKEFFSTNTTKDYKFRYNNILKLEKFIKENDDKIAELLSKDLKRDVAESYFLEIHTCLEEINYYKKRLKKMMKPKRVKSNMSTFSSKSFVLKEPKGVTLIVSPWNYPFYLTIIPLINNIGAGNTAIIKLSERLTYTNKYLEEELNKLYAPEYIKVLPSDKKNYDAIELNVDHIFFTGSTNVGKKVMKSASENLIPVTLELGGKSPVIVTNKADVKLVVSELIFGKLINSGQTCIAPDHVYIQSDIYNQVLREFEEQIKNYQVNHRGYIDNEHHNSVTQLLEGNKILLKHDFENESLYITEGQKNQLSKQEIFGMILPFIKYQNFEQILEKINYPLATYIFTNDKSEQKYLINNITCRGFTINGTITHIANHNLPFGGIKNSGIGQYTGQTGFDELTYTKALLYKGWFKPFFINPPYNYERIKKILNMVRKIK